MDDPILTLVLLVAVVGLLAPLVALLLSIRPNRATRPAGYVCAVVAAIAAIALGVLIVDAMTTEVNEFGEGGDDSGVVFAMGAIAVFFLVANVIGWAVAHRRTRDAGPRDAPHPDTDVRADAGPPGRTGPVD